MWFLIKFGSVLSLVLLMLPIESDDDANPDTASVLQTFYAAKATVSDLSQFCDRNPDTCLTAQVAAETVIHRGQEAIRIIGSSLTDEDDTQE